MPSQSKRIGLHVGRMLLPPISTLVEPMLDSGSCPRHPNTSGSSASSTPPRARASRSRSIEFDQSTHTAAEAAAAVGAELGQIVKSLVFVAPADGRRRSSRSCASSPARTASTSPALRRSPASATSGGRRLARPTSSRGSRSVASRRSATLRPVRVIMDPDLGRFPIVWAAAGTPTAVFPVPPATLRILANATVAPITEERRRRPTSKPELADRRARATDALDRRTPGRDPARHGRRAARRRRRLSRAACVPAGAGAGAATGRRYSPCPSRAAHSPITAARVGGDFDALCRAELRIEAPGGAWTARLASTIFDEPAALFWDNARPVRREVRLPHVRVRRPFGRPALVSPLRDAAPRGIRVAATGPRRRPVRDRDVRDRARRRRSPGGSPTPTSSPGAELVGGRLVLTSYGGAATALDPATGRSDRLTPVASRDRPGRTVDNRPIGRPQVVDKRVDPAPARRVA